MKVVKKYIIIDLYKKVRIISHNKFDLFLTTLKINSKICTINCRSPPISFNFKNFKLNGGKFMQYEVDKYVLEKIGDKYYLSFKDSVKNDCKLEISKEIFDVYVKSRVTYIKIKNETSRHLEQSTLTEEEIYNRAFNGYEDVEEKVMKNIEKKKLNRGMQTLTETQARRIELHIVNEVTIRDLARLENVNKKQIEKSLKLGLKKLKKFFEK